MRAAATIFIGLVLGCLDLEAATVTAASCGRSDVVTAASTMTAGDTLIIPSGNCSWTTDTYITFPANTIVTGQTTCTGSGRPGTNNLECTDNTILTMSGSGRLNVTTASTGTFRFTGVTFAWGGGPQTFTGAFSITSHITQARVDHVHFDSIDSVAFSTTASTGSGGVFDHILLDGVGSGWKSYGDDAISFGDRDWAAATALGAANFFFFENSRFNDVGNDCFSGGRWVVRYNTFVNNGVQTHPTASRGRGCRAWELYGNSFESATSNNFNVFFISSGTGVIWGNSTPGNTFTHFVTLHSMRRNNSTYTQVATPNGWGYCGTSFNGTGSNWDENTIASTGYHCMDQPGMGRGDRLINDFPNVTNQDTGCTSSSSCAWPRQASEPIYEWLNTFSTCCGGSFWQVIETDAFVANSDYYLYTASFTGATGVGSGVHASRPATCTTGVTYWSTDQGSWNTSGSGGQGVLDKCTATDTWTDGWYVPHGYPHSLAQGPVVAAVSPAFGQQGAAVAVTLTGVGFQGGNATINAISGITISGTSIVSDTSITATFTIAGGATLGNRNVTVTTDRGTSNSVTFEVLASGSVPTITAISPSSGARGTTASVTLTGTNFTGGTVSLSGSGVTTDNCKVVSATSITCDFIVAASTGWGLREVTVTNGSGASNTANFFVSAPGIGPGRMRIR